MSGDELHFLEAGAEELLGPFFQRLYEEHGYYREKFDALQLNRSGPARSLLDRMPVLSPEQYGLFEARMRNELGKKRFLTDLTTGTTGKRRIRFSTMRDEAAEAQLCERFFRQCGIGADDQVLALDIDSADIYVFYAAVLAEMGVSRFVFGSIGMDSSQALRPLLRSNPSVLITVPTMVGRVLPTLKDEKLRGGLQALKKIIYIGENMPVFLRGELERVLGVEVFSFFGSTEIGSVGGECQAHCGIHIFWDCVIPSLIAPRRDNGHWVGEVVWTTLHFRDQPLVKFATGDIVTLAEGTCACGQEGPRLLHVRRCQDEFSLYGHSFFYEAFTCALATVTDDAGSLQVEVSDREDHLQVTFHLPLTLRVTREEAYAALTSADELSYFIERGFVQCEVEFHDRPFMEDRKLRRVIDRRLS